MFIFFTDSDIKSNLLLTLHTCAPPLPSVGPAQVAQYPNTRPQSSRTLRFYCIDVVRPYKRSQRNTPYSVMPDNI